MFDLLKHKYHAIFIDPGLNSTHTILRNVYQNFLLCAMKFYCHVAALHRKNEDFLMGVIFAILNFGYSRLQSRYTELQIPKNRRDITENHVIWYAWSTRILYRSPEEANWIFYHITGLGNDSVEQHSL
ncbi:hypothetical protein BC936DRAFT_139467 [Jimgerdemannia flammicorona]|uniref:Telomerase reverse transcriptase n=1 Tax=Jimgerdemannia flammicorona TaxID=994334 RepID=A0A433B9U4_9FUNG|nr:hypothetical protein BC936DRAFT_139467 [Jimgerdemannia flammicorona]